MNVRHAHSHVMSKPTVLRYRVPTNVDVRRDIMEIATIHAMVWISLSLYTPYVILSQRVSRWGWHVTNYYHSSFLERRWRVSVKVIYMWFAVPLRQCDWFVPLPMFSRLFRERISHLFRYLYLNKLIQSFNLNNCFEFPVNSMTLRFWFHWFHDSFLAPHEDIMESHGTFFKERTIFLNATPPRRACAKTQEVNI